MATGHQINFDGSAPANVSAINSIRQAQETGLIGEYAFVITVDGGVMIMDTPPHVHLSYLVVPRDKPVYYHYGLDSMLHIDWREYLKWFQHLQSQDIGEKP
jgi:hypothetical protein